MGANATSFSCSEQVKLAMTPTSRAFKLCAVEMWQRIAEARARAGLSQSELARQVGVKPQSVQQWEKKGGTAPRGHRLNKIADTLGVTRAWLLGVPESAMRGHGVHVVADERPLPHDVELLAARWRELPDWVRRAILKLADLDR